jgi:hypothetical protein
MIRPRRISNVTTAYNLIEQYGIPPFDRWTFISEPQSGFRQHRLEIPFLTFSGGKPISLDAMLILYYPPTSISYKIFDFKMEIYHRTTNYQLEVPRVGN